MQQSCVLAVVAFGLLQDFVDISDNAVSETSIRILPSLLGRVHFKQIDSRGIYLTVGSPRILIALLK